MQRCATWRHEWVHMVRAVLDGSHQRHMAYHMMMARRQVLVQLDDDTVEQLDELAERLSVSRSELL